MTGLVGWWPLHEQSGDANDLSGNGNHGTVNGATQGIAGKGGLTAYSFSDPDNVSIADDDILDFGDGEPFSICAWAKIDPSDTSGRIVAKRSTSNSYWELLNQSGNARFLMDDSTTQLDVTGSTPVNTDAWVHIAGTFDGIDSGVVYLNGEQDGAATQAIGSISNGVPVTIGERGDGNNITGKIADVRLYNRELSQNEIQTLYEWGAGGLGSIPEQDDGGVSYYKLDGDATDSWGDNSGSVSGATLGVSGIRNTAYSFDGGDDVITIPHDSSLDFSTTSFSISVWINTTSSANGRILHKGSATGTWWAINYNQSSNLLQYFFDDDSNAVSVTEDISRVSTGNWHHLAFTLNRESNLIGYIDGTSIGSTDATGLGDIDIGADLEVGADPTESIYFEGEIDEIRIYDRALGADEVKALYNYDDGGNLLGELAKPPTNANGGVSWYEFRGDASDSWGDNDGTVNGATFVSNAGPRGQGAYSFDGVDDYVEINSTITELSTNTEFTVSMWINLDSTSGVQQLISSDNGSSDRTSVNTNGTELRAGTYDGSSFQQVASGHTLTTGVWHHVAYVARSSDGGIYLNGTEATGSNIPSTDTGGRTTIGVRNNADINWFGGLIDDVRIYDRALSQREISQLYRYGTLGRDMRELTVNAR